MAPEMTPVESTSAASVGYDAEKNELWVEYVDGGTYVYSLVPASTYRQLMGAASIGRFINREIKPRHGAREVQSGD